MVRLPVAFKQLPAPIRRVYILSTSQICPDLLPWETKALVQKGQNLTGSFASQEVKLADFYLTLESMLAQEFTPKPTTWQNGVRLLTPTEARGLSFRVSFVVGLNEGVVPHLNPAGWLLREETVQDWMLASFLPTNRDQLLRERVLFSYVLKTAREKLVLTCSQTNAEGEEVNPSSFWDDLKNSYQPGNQLKRWRPRVCLLRSVRSAPALWEWRLKKRSRLRWGRHRDGRARNGYLGPSEAQFLQAETG